MNKDAYASYGSFPNISYKILEYLMQNSKAEIIWKLLKYTDSNAYEHDNLTLDEKAKLIYYGGDNQEEYNVFLDYGMDDATEEEKTFLRIYPSIISPENRTIGICAINFEVLSHSKINHLSNYTTRTDVITQNIISVLNGADVGGVGVMFFDRSRSSLCRTQLMGQKPFKGKITTMATNIG